MRRTRVLVADSFSLFRCGVRSLLQANTDFDVVEATSLAEVLQAAEDSPDIALVELDLPGGGLEAVAWLSERCACRTIVWSDEPCGDAVLDAIHAGASGYFEKTISLTGLVRALRRMEHGEAPLSPELATLLVEALHGRERSRVTRERAAVLSARERQVLDLVARGARNSHIARELVISEFTVKRHVQNILKKLDLPSRYAAARFYTAAAPSGGKRVPSSLGGAA